MHEITWYLSFSDWLISLNIMFSKSIHAVAKGKIFCFLFFFNSQVVFIPLGKCPIVVLSIHLLIDTGCFHTVVIVNNAAMNIGMVLMLFQISVLGSFRYIPRSGITGSRGRSIFNFWGISILFSTVAAPVYIPTNSAKGFPFLHILISTCCLWIYQR